MSQQRKVAFRRIHGHIVPIKLSDEKLQGAALIGTGLAVAGAAGSTAAKMAREAAHLENVARNAVKATRATVSHARALGPLFEEGAKAIHLKQGLAALKTMAMARGVQARSFRIKKIGVAAASTLIATGVHRALKNTEVENTPGAREVVASTAGLAAHFALRSAYYKSIGAVKNFEAIKMAASKVVKGFAR